jgi:hypothetical protein
MKTVQNYQQGTAKLAYDTLLAIVLSLFKRKPKKRCHDVPLAQRDTCMPNDIRICKKCSEYY